MAIRKKIDVCKLPVGATLRSPIADPHNPNVRLLTEGVTISRTFLEQLARRGITEVVVSQRDLAMLNAFKPQGRRTKVPPPHLYVQSLAVNDHTKAIDELVHREGGLEVTEPQTSVADQLERPLDCGYEEGLTHQWASDSDKEIEDLELAYEETVHGNGASLSLFQELCKQIISRLREDVDALVCLAGAPYESDYPTRHSVHVASMAMAIGVEMGLDEPSLIDLGIGCLVHDLGMQKIGVNQFQRKEIAAKADLVVLADHPVYAMELTGNLDGELSDASKFVAYQIHERLDGSGYPRGRSSDQVHPLARIAGIADAFIAMVAARPHRLGIMGYYAIRQLLDETKAGKFDPTVMRALLHVTSLYPIGSCVDLSNNQVGRVIRSGGADYDKPTIAMWPADATDSTPEIINLKEESAIKITRSIPSFDAA